MIQKLVSELSFSSSFEDFLKYEGISEEFAQSHPRIVGSMAIKQSIVIEQRLNNARLAAANEQLNLRLNQAEVDQKTGCLTADAFARAIADRYDNPDSSPQRDAVIVVLDLKGMKGANDQLGGHAAGDSLLTATGQALRELTRESDIVGRIGQGDEFAVVMEPSHTDVNREQIAAGVEERFAAVFGRVDQEPALRAPLNDRQDMLVAARFSVMLCEAPCNAQAIAEKLQAADQAMTKLAEAESSRGLPPKVVPKRQ